MRRVALTGAGVLAGSALTLAGLLWRWSPGRPRPFLDAAGQVLAGSIAEKLRVKLNGVEQGRPIQPSTFGCAGPAIYKPWPDVACSRVLIDYTATEYWAQGRLRGSAHNPST